MAFLNYTQFVLTEAETFLENYSRLQLVLVSAVSTWFLLKICDFCEDGDFTWSSVKGKLFRVFIKLPYIRNIAATELETADKAVVSQCRSIYRGEKFLLELPRKGLKRDNIFELFKKYQNLSKVDWRKGRASGTVYSDLTEELSSIVKQIYSETAYTNPLHPECFPGINKMEAEVVRMVCNLFNGNEHSCGTLTSGGTESIVLAVKAYRDYARHVKGITKPELVVPVTAHAAFQKACQYFCIKFKSIPVDPVTYKADIKAMRRAISRNTILLVGSACGYPHGIIDDIASIGQLGVQYDIPVHTDCCLGGFLVPFLKDAEFPIDPVDFSVPGVTSISADTHKYGYAPKGSSVIMYADKKFRKHQFSVQTDWPGGIYASPTIAGSRCGANIATCWASLLYYGFDGYVDATKKILTTQRYLKSELSKLKGIFIVGDPMLSVIAVGSNDFNIFRLSDKLSELGWNINPLQFPSAFHICVTLMHVQEGVAEAFLGDFKVCLAACMREPSKSAEGLGVVYGMAQSIPDRSIVSDIACQYLNSIYDTS